MHARIVLLALLTALAAGCKNVDCGDGTTERNGICVPSSETVGTAQCGPFTELHGDRCVPIFPPTLCDPATTQPDVDELGVVTCIGTGGGGCAAKLPCPVGTAGRQTICGQLYDFENNQPYAAASPTGTKCIPGATSGPCALGIKAYDAVAFAQGNTTALATGEIYIDDCGRYKVADIAQPAGPFIALAIDDADPTKPGPLGTTNAVGVATNKAPNTATKDFEAFIVKPSTTAAWGSSGGPVFDMTHGIYAPVFRGHRAGTDQVSGVTVIISPMVNPPTFMGDPARDYYFAADPRLTVSAINATGPNGTALLSGASLTEIYSGVGGGLPTECRWDIHGGASIGFVVFIQIFRPVNNGTATCSL